MKGQNEDARSKLLLIEEKWSKREKNKGKLLFTREEWLKRTTKENVGSVVEDDGTKQSKVL